ncbi:MAG: aminotransferase class I/II-fold pyridoxal phosphate-dependent enzyme [Deltaproteobacteria bacterium]|nr:aminotransferase class I/II-fold pyridoxal phosphate-dependent enzyme [Deltaproteobacteria bacterium]
MPFDDRLQEFLDALDARDRRRTLLRLDAPTGPWTQEGSRRLVNLCSNDYLSLAGDPRLAKAAAEAAERYGAGSGASRLITGNLPIHEELEAEAARFTGREAALLFDRVITRTPACFPPWPAKGM